MDDPQALLGRLKPIHIFQGLQDEDILEFARALEVEDVPAGETLFTAGEPGEHLYIIDRGQVSVEHPGRRVLRLEPGDYFGEGSLLYGRPRTTTARTESQATLLRLGSEAYAGLLERFPQIKPNLLVEANSRELYRQINLDWLEAGETVHLLARRHPLLLWQTLIPSLLALLGVLVLAILAYLTYGWQAALALSALGGLPMIGWAIWTYIDWGNDLYVVTDQRVVYVEKVIGVFDSRQEAPLRAVQSVTVETAGSIERTLGIGNVVVRTLAGAIVMTSVANPEAMAALVEEHWNRAKTRQRQQEQAAVRRAVRQRIGLPVEPLPPAPPPPPRARRNPLAEYFSFSMRLEQEGRIIYRKHWYILLQTIWQPSLCLLADAGVLGLALGGVLGSLSLGVAALAVFVIAIPLGVWWWYEYEDWRNDLYLVTVDQIVDVYKRPFGQEMRKTAPLANVLSLKYDRPGLLGLLLNYGTVSANVAGQEFDFEGVFDPRGVQNDIYRRIEALQARKTEAEAERRREELADSAGVLHRLLTEATAETPPLPPIKPKSEP